MFFWRSYLISPLGQEIDGQSYRDNYSNDDSHSAMGKQLPVTYTAFIQEGDRDTHSLVGRDDRQPLQFTSSCLLSAWGMSGLVFVLLMSFGLVS